MAEWLLSNLQVGVERVPNWLSLFLTPPTAICWTLCSVFLVYRVASYVTTRATWKTLPTRVFVINPTSRTGNILPCSKKWNPGIQMTWNERHTCMVYTSQQSETVAVISVLDGSSIIYTSSPEVIQQVLANKAPYSKPKGTKATIGFLGENVLASDGETWKMHRKIVAPAFNQEGYRRVWEETLRTYQEMSFAEGWDDHDNFALPTGIQTHTRKLALFIIASCGFNIPLAWGDAEFDEDGRLSFQAMMTTVATSILTRALTPGWAYYLPSNYLRRVDTAYRRLQSFLGTQINIRKNEILQELGSAAEPNETKRELFSRLVAASLSEGKSGLSDQEIISNTFVLLFAGHETTALTLSTTIVLLALYEEEQARVHKHILNVLGDRIPTYEDYEALEPVVLSAVYEALRLYPPAPVTLRKADQDTTLSLPTKDGLGANELYIPKGTEILVDFLGAGYNQRWYTDTDMFRPSRWGGRFETALPFSDGPRVCIGRKFATTEMVCFLSLMLRDWELHISRDLGESREQWRERYMQPRLAINMAPPPVPLKLARRRK